MAGKYPVFLLLKGTRLEGGRSDVARRHVKCGWKSGGEIEDGVIRGLLLAVLPFDLFLLFPVI